MSAKGRFASRFRHFGFRAIGATATVRLIARRGGRPTGAPSRRLVSFFILAFSIPIVTGMLSGAAVAAAPTLSADPVTSHSVTTAHLTGTITTDSEEANYFFEYAEAGTGAWNAGPLNFQRTVPAGTTGQSVDEDITGLKANQEYEVKLVAFPPTFEKAESSIVAFTTDPAPNAPLLTVDSPTASYTTAHLSGTVNPEGGNEDAVAGPIPIQWELQVNREGEGWQTKGSETIEGAGALGSSPIPVEVEATELLPDSEYEVRLRATFAGHEVVSVSTATMQTLAVPAPTVALEPVSAITGDSAHFQGTVNPGAPGPAPQDPGFDTHYRFECEPACPNTPEQQTIPGDAQDHTVAFDPAGLEPNTPYQVKLVAENVGGQSVSEREFATQALPPSVAVGPVGGATEDSARLTAYVDANNSFTTVRFEYATNHTFLDARTVPAGSGSSANGNGGEIAYADIVGLEPDTAYYWRATAQNSYGSDSREASVPFNTFRTPQPTGMCPNEGLRQEQGSTQIAGCRAWELVSTSPEAGQIDAGELSDNGERALYRMSGGADASSFGEQGWILSQRTDTGWRALSAVPSRDQIPPSFGNAYVLSANHELTTFTVALSQRLLRPEGPAQFIRYEPQTRQITMGSPWAGPFNRAVNSGTVTISSEDQTSSFSQLQEWSKLFDISGPQPQELALPDGEELCGEIEFARPIESNRDQNWVSRDGRFVYFQAPALHGECGPPYLYVAEGAPTGPTRLVAGPVVSGDAAPVRLVQATPDGATAYFLTQGRLTDTDSDDTSDLYRRSTGAAIDCLTCGRHADVEAPIVAPDGKRGYLLSRRALAPGAQANVRNIYAWTDAHPHDLSFVAPGEGTNWIPNGYAKTVAASPDGKVLVFYGNSQALRTLAGRENEGWQYFRYDSESGELNCITCAAGSIPGPMDSATELPGNSLLFETTAYKPMTTDGDTFVFASSNRLIPADQNSTNDVYEWREGRVGLITPGEQDSYRTTVKGITPDGSTILFAQNSRLTPDATGTTTELYAARVGGGIPSLYADGGAVCSGESCRLPQSDSPGDVGNPGSRFLYASPAGPLKRCRKKLQQGRVGHRHRHGCHLRHARTHRKHKRRNRQSAHGRGSSQGRKVGGR